MSSMKPLVSQNWAKGCTACDRHSHEGLDFHDIKHVVSFGMPDEIENHFIEYVGQDDGENGSSDQFSQQECT